MKCMIMWFETPAHNWLESFPLGNGHIGCMLSGDPFRNTLCLNDDTLWSGYPRDYNKQGFRENLKKVRTLLLKNNRAKAEEIVETRLANRFTQAYLPLGDLLVESPLGELRNYRRALDLATGIVSSCYSKDGVTYSSETFVSFPDDVLVHTMESDAPADYTISVCCKLKHEIICDNDVLTLLGQAPSDLIIADVGDFSSEANQLVYDSDQKGMRFAARVQILTDGIIQADESNVVIRRARRVNLLLSCATSFSKGEAYFAFCERTAQNAVLRGIISIRDAHIRDHASLFRRTNLDLGDDDDSCKTRYARMKRGEPTGGDLSLLFQYGRYLLIASSRQGTQAANLQGIWNRDLIPPWWSGYTLNINLQMNYWLADRANLSECFEPFVSFAKRLCEAGKTTAEKSYGAKGSVAHHQSDLWAHTTPVGLDLVRISQSARWMMWNMPLPWLCIQMYDHYQYCCDERFLLDELYPFMKTTANFLESTFQNVCGKLRNLPTTSPENMYRDESGRALAVCTMSAMDTGIAKEFALDYADVCNALGKKKEASYWTLFSEQIEDYTVTPNEELMEWDGVFEQTELGHRHFSLLFGVFPGDSLIGTAYERAARRALETRLKHGAGQTGWSAVWATLLLARFGEGDAAYEMLRKLMQEHIHKNLLGAHPPGLFQIDANFGLTAAVCELLVQEKDGVLHLLPALPKALSSGSLSGVKVRGGHLVSLGWKDSRLEWIEVEGVRNGEMVLAETGLIRDGAICISRDGSTRIPLQANERYRFVCRTGTEGD